MGAARLAASAAPTAMNELDRIVGTIGDVAVERDRLERETARIAERTGRELAALEATMAHARAQRDRSRIVAEEERERLERLAAAAERALAERDALDRRADWQRRRIPGQEQLVAMLVADLECATRDRREALAQRDRVAQSAAARQRALAAQRRRLQAEIASLTAAQAEVEAALAAVPGPPDVSHALTDIHARRALIEAELSPAAEPSAEEGDAGAFAAEEPALHRIVEEHAEKVRAMRALAQEARARVQGGHFRFAGLDRLIEEEAERAARSLAEADETALRAGELVRELELSIEAERGRLEELGRELAEAERASRESVDRSAASRQEAAEERVLRALMIEQATLEVALESVIAERDRLDRVLGRMLAVAALS